MGQALSLGEHQKVQDMYLILSLPRRLPVVCLLENLLSRSASFRLSRTSSASVSGGHGRPCQRPWRSPGRQCRSVSPPRPHVQLRPQTLAVATRSFSAGEIRAGSRIGFDLFLSGSSDGWLLCVPLACTECKSMKWVCNCSVCSVPLS